MRRLVVILLLMLSACIHVQIGGTSGTPPAMSANGVQVQASGALTAVVLAGMLAAAATQDLRDPQPAPSRGLFDNWMGTRPRAEMKPDRAIAEQDCTKPIELSENLRCR